MTEIGLDWDMPYSDRYSDKLRLRKKVQERLDDIIGTFGNFNTWSRPSPNKRIHLKCILERQLSDFECFQFRAIMGDDPMRVAIDLKRYVIDGIFETDRLWDTKIEVTGTSVIINESGEWEDYIWKNVETGEQ
jgi:hypothetical protein